MRALGGLLLIAVLAGCAGDYETFEPPPLDFSGRPPLRFAVDSVSVQSAYRPAGRPPFVDHTLVLTPEAAPRALLHNLGRPGLVHTLQRGRAALRSSCSGPALRAFA